MDATQFLSRVVAPGNYIAVAYKRPGEPGMRHRFFPRTDVKDAANFATWLSGEGTDVWYGLASFKLASPDKKGFFRGERTQANAQALRALWLDADISRPGDNKAAGKAYADWRELAAWVKSFAAATGLPVPNAWVNSGYGAHLYWVLEDELPEGAWRPYAEAFKAALAAHDAKGDLQTTADSARLLRPPETFNYKVQSSPQPTEVLSKLTRGDYPNDLIYQALQPYMGAVSAKVSNYSSGGNLALSGSPPTVAAMRQSASSSTAAAQTNLPAKREYLFSEIAKKCEQAKQSLSTGGAGDGYPLWYLGFISLSVFCSDGAVYGHEISKADPRYTPQSIDAALQQADRERHAKGTGAPTCSAFNGYRSGVCQSCPHFGKVNSPYSLGAEDGDLPDEYYRHAGGLWRRGKVTSEGDRNDPVKVVGGDVYSPTLDRVGEDRKLTFLYDRAGTVSCVEAMQSAIPVDAKGAMHAFGPQGVTLYDHNAREFGRFVVSWIEKLRDMRAERAEAVPAFGWTVKADSSYGGFSVAGTVYKPDGSEEPAPGGDNEINKMYKPRGSLDEWRLACEFVTKGRPDLQVIVAASFAAPLIEFTGHSGVVMSVWSRNSAVGKSSAFQVGTSVWAEPKAMLSFDDTSNSVHYRIGKTKVMPAYWDEILVNKETATAFVDTLFKLGQGKDKSRLNSDSTLKATGDWKTVLIVSGNRPLMDFIVRERADTDAGAVRLFEICLEHPQMPLDANAAQTIAKAGKNAGNAGRMYAKWLSQNIYAARLLTNAMQDGLTEQLSAVQPERFYIAGMASILVGAYIAQKHLGMNHFDVPAMKAFLVDAFNKLRSRRQVDLPVNAGVFDIERVLANFISDHASDRLLTTRFKPPGPKGDFKVIWMPRKMGARLAIHIGRANHKMRVDKFVFDEWCYARGYSPSDTVHMMEYRWGAQVSRFVLGDGTDFATGRVPCIEIPLTSTELKAYNYEYDSSNGRAKQ